MRVVAKIERHVPAAAFDFEQRNGEAQVAGAHVDVLARAAPVAAGGPHARFAGVDGAGWRRHDCEHRVWRVPVPVLGLHGIGIGCAGSHRGIRKRGRVGRADSLILRMGRILAVDLIDPNAWAFGIVCAPLPLEIDAVRKRRGANGCGIDAVGGDGIPRPQLNLGDGVRRGSI